jgi:hypothetical protein
MTGISLILATLLGQVPGPGREEPPARIEVATGELARASMVRLDFVDRPLDEVLREFGSPTPSPLAWHPETPAAYRRQRLTLREAGPLPFWAAIDRLCRAGELKYATGSPNGRMDLGLPVFRLFLAPGSETCPHADDGPLRLEVVYLEHSRRVNLVPIRPDRKTPPADASPRFGELREEFRIDFHLLAEPRLLISRVGSPLITEAVDDRGQPLPPADRRDVWHPPSYPGSLWAAQACVGCVLRLKHPERPGKVIKRLRMILPVEVVAREPGRLVIPLADARGKTFRHGETTIRSPEVERNAAGLRNISVTIRSAGRVPERLAIGPDGEVAPSPYTAARPEFSANVFQVLDDRGRQFPISTTLGAPESSDLSVHLFLGKPGLSSLGEPAGRGVVPYEETETAVPAELHHTNLSRGVLKATFELTDIPLP